MKGNGKPPPPEKPPKTTFRQRKFIAEKLKGKSSAQAARDAGYSDRTAKWAESKVATKPAVAHTFATILAKAGLTDSLLALRIRQGVNATETKFFPQLAEGTIRLDDNGKPIRLGDGSIIRDAPTAEDIPSIDVIDFAERRAMAELACRIKQVIPKDPATGETPTIQVCIIHVGGSS